MEVNDQSDCKKARTSRWWKSPIVWTSLLVASLLIYEVTAQPTLGVLVLCSKFGWDEVLMAYWLRRVDSNRPRARTFFWFFLAIASFNVSAAAVSLSLLLFVMFVAFKVQRWAAPFPPEILAASILLCVGLLIALFALLVGFCAAFKAKLRIWLTYPPLSPRQPEKENLAWYFLAIVMFLFGFISFELIALIGIAAFDRGGKHAFLFGSLILVLLSAIAALAFKIFFVLKRRLIADHPSECWEPDSIIGGVMVSQTPIWKKREILALISKHEDVTKP